MSRNLGGTRTPEDIGKDEDDQETGEAQKQSRRSRLADRFGHFSWKSELSCFLEFLKNLKQRQDFEVFHLQDDVVFFCQNFLTSVISEYLDYSKVRETS